MGASIERLSLHPPSPEDVIKAINNLNNTDATGEDGITVAFLKLSAPVIALPLARLTEISFQSGLIPKAFKSGNCCANI